MSLDGLDRWITRDPREDERHDEDEQDELERIGREAFEAAEGYEAFGRAGRFTATEAHRRKNATDGDIGTLMRVALDTEDARAWVADAIMSLSRLRTELAVAEAFAEYLETRVVFRVNPKNGVAEFFAVDPRGKWRDDEESWDVWDGERWLNRHPVRWRWSETTPEPGGDPLTQGEVVGLLAQARHA